MTSKQDVIIRLQSEICILKKKLLEKEEELKVLCTTESLEDEMKKRDLTRRDVVRYSRQIIVPSVGVQGQLKLKKLSVLIVGVGGLGCPAALYLAGAGVGRLGLVDYDTVEENNLHRQLLHNEDQLGKPKVISAMEALKKVNHELVVEPHRTQLSSHNALELVSAYDVVLDASDNVATRYLVSDACVLAGRPLVSGSALQLEGQLTVYHHADGPCYRCLYPSPPPPHTVTNCSDAGVLGPVPGIIGTLQALEAMKIALGIDGVLSSRLLLFDGESSSFRTVRLRKKNPNCPVCGTNPTIKQLIDYEQFCGAAANDKDKQLSLLSEDERISADQLHGLLQSETPCIVVDVRQEAEFQMCSIPGSVNIPLPSLFKNIELMEKIISDKSKSGFQPFVCVVCRRGNDSQLAVRRMQPLLNDLNAQLRDLRGGLHSWASNIDNQFPVY